MNARLGALVARQGITDPGEDLRPLRPQDYVTDVLEICQDENAEWEDFEAELDEKRSEH